MTAKLRLAGLALVVSLLVVLGLGCASESEVKQPPTTSYMRSQVGTPNEMSPLAPPGARNVRKVGNQWMCDVNGRTMVYNPASTHWEPHR
jgi:uncharacterized lipoprotein